MFRFFTEKPDLKELQFLFKLYDSGNYQVDNWRLDEILGIKPSRAEEGITQDILKNRLGDEQFTYEGTPYSFIRDFLHFVNPNNKDVVYDLGSGYGRIVFYGVLTTDAKYVGIEIVPERVRECLAIKERFNIKNVSFIQANINDCLNVMDRHPRDGERSDTRARGSKNSFDICDLSNGTIFFLFNPFNSQTLENVSKKLHHISKHHQIKIASWGGPSDRYFRDQPWLKNITPKKQPLSIFPEKLNYFESR